MPDETPNIPGRTPGKKATRAELAAEVRALRAVVDALVAANTAHHCHGCTCTHLSITPPPYVPPAPMPYWQPQVWCGTVTGGTVGTGGTSTMPDNYTVTAVN